MNKLILKLSAFNATVISFIGLAFVSGWIWPILMADITGITWLILGLAIIGIFLSFYKSTTFIGKLRKEYEGSPSPQQSVEYSLTRANANFAIIPTIANAMIMLGIVGTVIGLIIALQGINPSTISDANAIANVLGNLLHGISIKLSTTLFGILGNLWLMCNHYFLTTEVQNIVTWANSYDDESIQ